jgi:hypothetical protein
VIPAGFIPTDAGLVAFAGAPGGTLRWRGYFLRVGGVGPLTKEALQTHRWMNGFEKAPQGQQETGAAASRASRDASRTLDGMGLALRSTTGTSVVMAMPTTGTGFPTRQSWERIYLRIRKYPTANEMLIGWKGSVEAGTAGLLSITPQGNLAFYNKGNQAFPGTLCYQGGNIPLNQWVKLDVLLYFCQGVSDGKLFAFINGALVLSAVATASITGGAGGLFNTVQVHSTSYVGNEGGSTAGLEVDYDDWSNKTIPLLFTGDDWLQGTHIYPLAITGYDTGHSGSWVGDYHLLDATPANGQTDFVTTSTAGVKMAVTTDYRDRQAGCSGLQVSIYHASASSTSEQLGYAINGGADVTNAVTTVTGAYAIISSTAYKQILYSAGGNLTAPLLNTVGLRYIRDGAATLRNVAILAGAAEYIGVWGAEDPANLSNPSEFPPRQGPHNSPYYDQNFAQPAFAFGTGDVSVMSGTYVGNGTGQDITISMPAHWVWIRPVTSGGTGGSRWWSSLLSGHDPLRETPVKGNLTRCFNDGGLAGPSTSYKFRVGGTGANVNNTGITYQYVAFSDRSMRFCLNGAYLTLAGTASFSQPLLNPAFTPIAGFLLPEIDSAGATTGLYYKGPGHAADAASIMDSAEAATVCTFGAGTITPKTILNLTASQTAYSLWRASDSDGLTCGLGITSYTGDGTGARNIALSLGGKSPLFAMVLPHNGIAYTRDPSHTGSNSSTITAAGGSFSTTAITGGNANQITVGATLNAGGIIYDVFVLPGTTQSGWSPNPAGPIPIADPVPPIVPPLPPTSSNGWWSSTNGFTGAATLRSYPPDNPHDARDWGKINIFATGNAGFYAGFPPPGVMVNNFFIYAGNDYATGTGQPTIRIFDGRSDRSMITVPDVVGVKTIAIIAMVAINGKIYFTTLDSGTSSANWTGRVFQFDPDTLTLVQMGTQFTGGEVPYALCYHMGRLFMGTNKGDGSAAKIYWFRIGIDTAWTQDYTLTTSSVGGCLSLASFQGLLYVGCNATAAMATNKILVRDTAGAYTTSLTLTTAGTFRASNGVPAMIVFNNKLYATFWNPDTVPDCYIKQFDGTSWTTVYTGAGVTVRPFSGLFTSKNVMYVIGGGSGLSACLVRTLDGATFTDLTAFLTGPTTITAMPVVAQIGS